MGSGAVLMAGRRRDHTNIKMMMTTPSHSAHLLESRAGVRGEEEAYPLRVLLVHRDSDLEVQGLVPAPRCRHRRAQQPRGLRFGCRGDDGPLERRLVVHELLLLADGRQQVVERLRLKRQQLGADLQRQGATSDAVGLVWRAWGAAPASQQRRRAAAVRTISLCHAARSATTLGLRLLGRRGPTMPMSLKTAVLGPVRTSPAASSPPRSSPSAAPR